MSKNDRELPKNDKELLETIKLYDDCLKSLLKILKEFTSCPNSFMLAVPLNIADNILALQSNLEEHFKEGVK